MTEANVSLAARAALRHRCVAAIMHGVLPEF
jgi:hypothetical protein